MSWLTKVFTRINWQDRPSTSTPLAARNLNKYDEFCDKVDDELISLNNTKANLSVVNGTIKKLEINETTGVIKATYVNGTVSQWDLNIEKIPVSFTLSEVGILTMKTDDGTEFTADIASVIKPYNFNATDTISFTKTYDATNKVYKVSAIVKEGSIQSKHLDPNYLAQIQVSVNEALVYKNDALESAKVAQRWAIGRDDVSGSATDNAKYYSQQANTYFSKALNASFMAGSHADRAEKAEQYARDSAETAAYYADTVSTKDSVVVRDEKPSGDTLEKYAAFKPTEAGSTVSPVSLITLEQSVIDSNGVRLNTKMSTLFGTATDKIRSAWSNLNGTPAWNKLKTYELTLPVASWENYTDEVNGAIFKQSVTASGVTNSFNALVSANTANFATLKKTQKCLSQCQVLFGTDTVEFYAKKKPDSELSVIITEVI